MNGKQRVADHTNRMRRPELPIGAKQLITVTIPYLQDVTSLVAGYDHFDGTLRVLDVGALRELEVLAEAVHSFRKLDARDIITANMPLASPLGTIVTATLTVPAGEVWFLGAVSIVSPAETGGAGDIAQVNFRVSKWVDQAAVPSALGQQFWPANQGTAALNTYDAFFTSCEGMTWTAWGDAVQTPFGLRLVAGDTLTLEAIMTGVPAAAILAATLTPYGFGGKVLVND